MGGNTALTKEGEVECRGLATATCGLQKNLVFESTDSHVFSPEA